MRRCLTCGRPTQGYYKRCTGCFYRLKGHLEQLNYEYLKAEFT